MLALPLALYWIWNARALGVAHDERASSGEGSAAHDPP
jgi:hypothetical protein